MRSDPGVVRNYGKLLVEMVSIVPDGIVCFFVSYSYMDGIINTWNESGLLKVKCILSLYLVKKRYR
jgi:DNA excision repair protein ERCC-2